MQTTTQTTTQTAAPDFQHAWVAVTETQGVLRDTVRFRSFPSRRDAFDYCDARKRGFATRAYVLDRAAAAAYRDQLRFDAHIAARRA